MGFPFGGKGNECARHFRSTRSWDAVAFVAFVAFYLLNYVVPYSIYDFRP